MFVKLLHGRSVGLSPLRALSVIIAVMCLTMLLVGAQRALLGMRLLVLLGGCAAVAVAQTPVPIPRACSTPETDM
jgi:hypothetical protein